MVSGGGQRFTCSRDKWECVRCCPWVTDMTTCGPKQRRRRRKKAAKVSRAAGVQRDGRSWDEDEPQYWVGGGREAPSDPRVITPVRGRAKGENLINKTREIYENNHLRRELEEEAIRGEQSGRDSGATKAVIVARWQPELQLF